jgi:hypothetical protein
MGKDTHLSLMTTLLLLISFGNLCSCLVALVHSPDENASALPLKSTSWSAIALALASGSQLLYLAFSAAWLFRWIRFYPGNTVESLAILAGLTLSAGAFVIALFGGGLKRWAGVFGSAITALLWLLSAVASVAV